MRQPRLCNSKYFSDPTEFYRIIHGKPPAH
ncbi:hypothetical protein J3A76_006604 [Methylobacterium sp. PvP109]|uniref:Uncharacterized protein n=1 Tax=Methylobacterium radiotolerans TaxID=31998 RepID=A0ABV2NTW6_9HYPH|nr:hypothetical protein [Methylobacterium sp. PvP105]MBP2505530.1 hypothetical protein [Methylobacterium sp. PvP109]